MPSYNDINKTFYGSAIKNLVNGKSDYKIENTPDGKKVTYFNSNSDFIAPTDAQITEKQKELKDAWDAIQYQRDRSRAYPEFGEQFDMLFHAIDSGNLDKTSDFYKELKKVKDANPKT
tara:strand:- start:849 stop:1202 length:354 start_codon:yes stop_codon:yes gene_type:complete